MDLDKPYKRQYVYYCDTDGHTRVIFADKNSYMNAEIGCTVIVIQFGENKNNMLAFVLHNRTYTE